ncbi:MAG: TerB family tellurite resistance protein [Paracoccaceae bacterium]
MHILLGLLAAIAAAAFWLYRAQAAREQAREILDGANDVRLAARRLLYKRKHNTHPADSVEDPRLAAAGIMVAVATMDAPISQTEIATMTRLMSETFDINEREALDMVSFGRWVADECGTNDEAVRRLAKVVAQEAGPDAGPDLIRMATEVAAAEGGALGDDENYALDQLRKALKME